MSRVSAATTSSSAPICSTLRSKARPYPWLSAPKNRTPVTATPTELPTCWAVDSAPDTDPAVAVTGVLFFGALSHGEQPGDRSAGPGVRRGQVQGGVAERRDHGSGSDHRPAEPHGQHR